MMKRLLSKISDIQKRLYCLGRGDQTARHWQQGGTFFSRAALVDPMMIVGKKTNKQTQNDLTLLSFQIHWRQWALKGIVLFRSTL